MIPSYTKIPTIGSIDFRLSEYEDIEFTVQEKIDGSLFAFGKIDGKVHLRSKNQAIDVSNVPSLFAPAVKHILTRELPEGTIFYSETLHKPRHNVLKYAGVPTNHVCLFSVYKDGWFFDEEALEECAGELLVDYAPSLYTGGVTKEVLDDLLKEESYLGGPTIEGVIVKTLIDENFVQGKFVSAQFKETMSSKRQTRKPDIDAYMDSFLQPARWNKAIQRLKEEDLLSYSVKDIGPLILELQKDIETECKAEILDFLWKTFGKQILKKASSGFVEYYKEYLFNAENRE